MKRSRFSEQQIIGILKKQEAGIPTADVCRRHGIGPAPFYNWKSKFSGLDVSEAKRVRALEEENGRLKKHLAEAMLDNAVLKDLTPKNGDARREAGMCSAWEGRHIDIGSATVSRLTAERRERAHVRREGSKASMWALRQQSGIESA